MYLKQNVTFVPKAGSPQYTPVIGLVALIT